MKTIKNKPPITLNKWLILEDIVYILIAVGLTLYFNLFYGT